jgi:hypothetical protein
MAELSVCIATVFDQQEVRRKCEKIAVAATNQQRLMCFNKGGFPIDLPMRLFVLESERKMLFRDQARVDAKIELVRTQLAKPS